MDFSSFTKMLSDFAKNGLGAPILILVMLSMLVLPLPPFALDLLFTFNIALSLIVLLVVVYSLKPLDFAVFPSFILIATLLRLGLNVASTRVVLLEGHNGGDAAGKVIEAFGAFVIGGNYAVGLVVFSILIIINFVVVTKGAGRVSEVSARFTLDAMPGKQMAIDADLNAGVLTQEQAKERRAEISQESDFYGSMDGASKFVRGDAVAGILILLINIVGGLGVGTIQHGLPFSQAMEYYTLLTIGDGLVAQIPALLLSTATAIIVTKVNSTQDMGEQVSFQVLGNPKALAITAVMIGILGLIPGMPNLVFITIALGIGYAAYHVYNKQLREETFVEPEPLVQEVSDEPKELTWDDVAPVDMIGLEVGYRLIPLVDKTQGGELMSRIKGVRKKLSQELGFLIPPVHIRDNLDLSPNVYRLTLMGVNIGEVEIHPDREMAINPGQVFGELQGIATQDPAFGLDAIWIESSQKDQAQTFGYTVVDPGTVVATHLSQIIQTHAHELLGHEEVQQMLDTLKKSAPKLVEDLVPDTLPLGVVVKVLQNLLQENIPVRDMRTISETLIEHGVVSQETGALTAAVRIALGRSIVQRISGLDKELSVITLDPDLERLLQQSLKASEDGGAGLEPGLAERMISALQTSTQKLEMEGKSGVLLVSAFLRPWLARFVRHSISNLNVLSYNEIPEDRQVRVVGSVGQNG
ncbi:MAG: flagellar biosynthesis protein FlhA [Piscirickettsiaceae bacterium]|nr:MAG: flagellar biosynthesis protein FlhA [Piscirickettsiaceae bacterium]PCI67777.1 MAG: flagellar biosynthesis protein FlhA [Piscirickettsiaceae bacterium]